MWEQQQHFAIFRRVFTWYQGSVECAFAAFTVSRGLVRELEGGTVQGRLLHASHQLLKKGTPSLLPTSFPREGESPSSSLQHHFWTAGRARAVLGCLSKAG